MITSVFMVVTWSSLFDQFLHFACTIGINKFTSRFEFQIRLHYAVMITKTSDLYWLFKQDEILQLESLKIQFVTSRKCLCVQRYCFRVDFKWFQMIKVLAVTFTMTSEDVILFVMSKRNRPNRRKGKRIMSCYN